MKYHHFAKWDNQPVSAFGIGCMRFNGDSNGVGPFDEEKAISLIRRAIDNGVNYIDTAYVYLQKTSETMLGHALRDGYRERVFIATKLPLGAVNEPADMEKVLAEELKKLETDHIDFYLLHGIDREEWDKFKAFGVKEFLDKKKAEGTIRHKCFSFHGSYDDFAYILQDYDWDMVQIQYNFMDITRQAGTRGLELAGALGIPVVIMEPLLGGKLAKAPKDVQSLYDNCSEHRTAVDWAFRFVLNRPEVAVVLSGINEPEQLEENLRIFDEADVNCLTLENLSLYELVRNTYVARTKVGCTGCRYCMPCPQEVAIPTVFTAWNDISLYENGRETSWAYRSLKLGENTPEKCLQCGVCSAACPQKLDIPSLLSAAWNDIQG